MPITGLERRRQKRVKVQLPMRLDYDNNEALASTKNVSLLGACLNMDRQILPGTRIAMSLDIPKYVEDENLIGEVRGEGAVVRCDSVSAEGRPAGYELGVFFSNFLPPGEEKLLNYLDHVSKEEEAQIRQWVEKYRQHIKERKRQIAKKKRALARKRAARLARRAKKAEMERLKRQMRAKKKKQKA